MFTVLYKLWKSTPYFISIIYLGSYNSLGLKYRIIYITTEMSENQLLYIKKHFRQQNDHSIVQTI